MDPSFRTFATAAIVRSLGRPMRAAVHIRQCRHSARRGKASPDAGPSNRRVDRHTPIVGHIAVSSLQHALDS